MKHNKEHIIDLFKRGFTPTEVVKKSGVSKSYAYNIRSQHKAEIEGKPKAKAKAKAKAKVKPLTMSEIGLKNSLAKARGEAPISFTDTLKSLDDMVNSPPHYTAGGIETIDFIEAKELDYHLGNVVKYITRSGHKGDKLKDLEKAQWYLNRAINNLKK